MNLNTVLLADNLEPGATSLLFENPSEIIVAHTPDEFIDLDDLVAGADSLCQLGRLALVERSS